MGTGLQLAKPLSLVNELKEKFGLLFPTYTIAVSTNSNGAVLSLSQSATPTAGQNNLIVQIIPQDTQFQDAIGLNQSVYSPMIAQVVEESSTISGVPVDQASVAAVWDYHLGRTGIKQQRYLRANGTAPSVSDIIAGNLVAQMDDVVWIMSQQ